ncbi:hypothetical protein BH20ACI2_BH20ACI2_21980 [soil metagenome]
MFQLVIVSSGTRTLLSALSLLRTLPPKGRLRRHIPFRAPHSLRTGVSAFQKCSSIDNVTFPTKPVPPIKKIFLPLNISIGDNFISFTKRGCTRPQIPPRGVNFFVRTRCGHECSTFRICSSIRSWTFPTNPVPPMKTIFSSSILDLPIQMQNRIKPQ